MSCAVNVSGTWKYAKQAHVNVNGTWKPCQNIYVNVSGAWKPLYTYSYETGSWGACSADCGGGTQTRTVTCRRRDATNASLDVQTVADSFCAAHGLTKPAGSQRCNTQACTECRYDAVCAGDQCTSVTGANYFVRQTTSLGNSTTYYSGAYWDGVIVARNYDGADEIVEKGYKYAKGEQVNSGMSFEMVGEGLFRSEQYSWCQVCRTPV